MEFQLHKFLSGNILILAIHKTFIQIPHEFKVHDTLRMRNLHTKG